MLSERRLGESCSERRQGRPGEGFTQPLQRNDFLCNSECDQSRIILNPFVQRPTDTGGSHDRPFEEVEGGGGDHEEEGGGGEDGRLGRLSRQQEESHLAEDEERLAVVQGEVS